MSISATIGILLSIAILGLVWAILYYYVKRIKPKDLLLEAVSKSVFEFDYQDVKSSVYLALGDHFRSYHFGCLTATCTPLLFVYFPSAHLYPKPTIQIVTVVFMINIYVMHFFTRKWRQEKLAEVKEYLATNDIAWDSDPEFKVSNTFASRWWHATN